MKKITLILFFLPFSLNMYSQKPDTIPLLKIKINPLLMISQLESGGTFEYRLRKRFAVEAGGGIQVPLTTLPFRNYAGYPFRINTGRGFTIRTGLRFYTKAGMYFNPVIFYRYMTYDHRYYWSSTRTDFSGVGEPGQYRFNPSNGGAEKSWERYVKNENKQVFAVEALIGREARWFRKIPVDIYAGVGCRYKYKQQEILHEKDGYVITDYSPPKKEIIDGYVPTIQAGVQIVLFKKPR